MVEFFDYNCGYCRKALGRRPGADQGRSEAARGDQGFPGARPRIARGEPGRARGRSSSSRATSCSSSTRSFSRPRAGSTAPGPSRSPRNGRGHGQAAEGHGRRPEVKAALSENRGLGDKLGLSGTPAFIIGDEIIPGAVGVEPIRKTIDGRAPVRPRELLRTRATPAGLAVRSLGGFLGGCRCTCGRKCSKAALSRARASRGHA